MGVREESVLTWTWAYRSGVASLRLVRAWRRSRGTTRRSSCRARVRVGRQRPSRRKPARCMRPWSLPCSSLCTSAPPHLPPIPVRPRTRTPILTYAPSPAPTLHHTYIRRPSHRHARCACGVRCTASWIAGAALARVARLGTHALRADHQLALPSTPARAPRDDAITCYPSSPSLRCRSRLYWIPVAWVSVCVWLGGRCAGGAAVAVTVAGRERGVSW